MKKNKAPKTFIIGVFLLIIPAQFAYAQSEEQEILKLISNADLELAKEKVDEIARKQPGSAKSLYFQALIEQDAEKAIKIYNDILLLYRKSGYAPKALYKVAQYYFVKGYYFSARKNFLDIARSYPNSKDVSVSQYYAAKCLLATGKTDSARIEFKNILSKNFSNGISELSSEELKAIEEETRASVPVLSPSQASQPNISQTEKKYTIQVGAYSRFENAESQKKYYTLRGYAVEIARAKVNRRYLYKVYIGRFTNQTEAQRFASALKNKHGLSYRIVKLED